MYTAGVFAMMIAIPKKFIGIVNIFTGGSYQNLEDLKKALGVSPVNDLKSFIKCA